MSAFDRMAGSTSAGNVASARRVNLGELQVGDWIAFADGRLLEIVALGIGAKPWEFVDVRAPVEDEADVPLMMTAARLASEMASVAYRVPRAMP